MKFANVFKEDPSIMFQKLAAAINVQLTLPDAVKSRLFHSMDLAMLYMKIRYTKGLRMSLLKKHNGVTILGYIGLDFILEN